MLTENRGEAVILSYTHSKKDFFFNSGLLLSPVGILTVLNQDTTKWKLVNKYKSQHLFLNKSP